LVLRDQKIAQPNKEILIMLKNTKVVGIAAAITLLAGVALAPSASAINGNVPTQTVSVTAYDAGDRVEYLVEDVRTGCAITTTLDKVSKTVNARQDKSATAKVVGKVSSFVKAPKVAGEYTVSSMVSASCASDAGYKRAADMADDVTVGDEVEFDGADDPQGGGVRVYGDVELSSVATDMGNIRVLFSVGGKVVASATTDAGDAGAVSATIAGKYLNSRGGTNVTVSLADNKKYYMSTKIRVNN
jgi:hypothetical protein